MPDNQTSPNIGDLWAKPTPVAPAPVAPASVGDLWGQSAPETAPTPTAPASVPTPAKTGGIGDLWGGSPSPENGQPKPAADPNEGMLSKAFHWANTPLTESLLGWNTSREGATGVEKGAEEVASGFTSPLSLALTLATFGTAGFLESAGANVLKQAGLSVADIATVGKGAEIAADAVKTGKIGEGALNTALKAADIDPSFYHGAMDKLYAARLTEADLTSGNAVERGVSQLARKVGLTPFQAQNVAKGVQTLASVGFTGQAAQSALEMSPRVLDALKDGDYEHAAEYATEAAASGLFAVAGASHALRAAGELVDPALGAKLRPTDEAMDLKRQFDTRDGDVQAAQEKGRLLEEQSIKALGHKNPLAPTTTESTNAVQNAQLAKIYHSMTLGFDKDLAAQHFNAIAEAAGRDERLPTGEDRLISRDQVIDAIKLANSRGKFTGNTDGAEALAKSIPQGEYVQARVPLSAVDSSATHPEITQQYATSEGPLPPSYGTLKDGKVFLEDGNHRAEAAKQRGETSIGVMMPKADFDEFRQQNPENGQHPALPSNLRELIQNSDLKNKPADYIDKLLASYKGAAEGLSGEETNVAKSLRDKLSKSWEDANTHNIMSDRIENYMRRVWKTPSAEVNTAIHDANNGRFETSVSMAKHRVFTDELTPILKGYELASEDPVRLTSQYLADTYKVIANRQFIDRIRASGIRASDGRPATALSGIGQTIGEGENLASLVTPNRVQNIRIADNEIERLHNSGDLQRHLESGVIEDVTPKARPWNLKDMIDRLEQKMTSSNVKFDEQGNSVALRDIQLLKDVRDGKRPASDLDEFNSTQKPVYVWRPQDYIKIDNAALRKAKFLMGDTAGNPIIAQSDMLVHPEYAKYLQTRLGLDKSGLQEWAPTRYLLKGGSIAKKTLLSFSPFHMNQEALRALMTGVTPFMKAAPTIEESPELRLGVENGLTVVPDYKGLQEHSEGLTGGSTLIAKIPVVGKPLAKGLDWYEHALFQKYIPNLKVRGYLELFDRYKDAHPDWTQEKVAEVASRHTNDTFGGQNWRAMGRSAATQDWARLLTLAPDWLESEVRSTARLFNRDEGGIGRTQVAKMAMYMWGVARVLNMVSTGHPHLEAPFGLAVKNDQGKETVYSMRTLPTDILHMASDPMGFLKGRLSPPVRAAQEVLSGRDQFGRKLSNLDLAVDLFRNVSPLPAQAIGQIITGNGPEVGNTGQVVKALGGTATVFRTEAAKKAAELASNHSEDGPIDKAMLHRHRVLMEFEDKLRTGEMNPQQLQQMVAAGHMPLDDLKKIQKSMKESRGLSPDLASLYTRASRLPAKELMDVYDVSTPSEQLVLKRLVDQKRREYARKSLTSMTPDERMSDPLLRRFMSMRSETPLF